MADFTKPNESPQDPQLSTRQLNAIQLILRNKNDREVAEAIGVTRETVNGWRNHHPVFQAALEEGQRELWASKKAALEKRIEEVRAVPLLTLEGIAARMNLIDYILLQGFLDRDEKCAQLIPHLRAELDQAKDYISSLTKDDSVAQQVALKNTEYREKLVAILLDILDPISPHRRDAILDELSKRMP